MLVASTEGQDWLIYGTGISGVGMRLDSYQDLLLQESASQPKNVRITQYPYMEVVPQKLSDSDAVSSNTS